MIFKHNQRGDMSILLSLMLLIMMLSSAIVLGVILSRQIIFSTDVMFSERAFYAADSGLEKALYSIAKQQFERDELIEIDEILPYPDEVETAKYSGQAKITAAGEVCASITGSFRHEDRRLILGPEDCFVDTNSDE